MTKTMRDMHESDKLVNRIEDAKAERLLMEVERKASRGCVRRSGDEAARRAHTPAAYRKQSRERLRR